MSGAEVALAVIGGAEVGKGALQYSAAAEKDKAIVLESKQRQLQYQQKSIENYELTNKILDTQIAQASTRGIAMNSPSFEATQRHTADVSARYAKNIEIEQDIFEQNVKTERENVRNSLIAQLLGDVGEAAQSFAGVNKAQPKLAGAK